MSTISPHVDARREAAGESSGVGRKFTGVHRSEGWLLSSAVNCAAEKQATDSGLVKLRV